MAIILDADVIIRGGGASMDPGWSNPANWVNGVPMAGDGLFFPAGGGHQNYNNNLAAGTTFSSLSFGGGGPPNYTLGGNSFALDAGIPCPTAFRRPTRPRSSPPPMPSANPSNCIVCISCHDDIQ